MKIPLIPNYDPVRVMRRSSYGQLKNGSFARRLGTYNYPRFHVYVENGFLDLHLDQKQASYDGSRAHSGEHDSEAVIAEGERIKSVMTNLSQTNPEAIPTKPKSGNPWSRFMK